MQRLRARVISYIMIISVCVSLWNPIGMNVVSAEGNAEKTTEDAENSNSQTPENQISYKLIFQDSTGKEITSVDASVEGETLDLYSLVKVKKTEGATTSDVETTKEAFQYTSSNEDIATVSKEGVVTVKAGSTEQAVEITVTWTGSSGAENAKDAPTATATFTIHVKKLSIESIDIKKSEKTMIVKDTFNLSNEVDILPAGAAKELVYKSANEEVVSVDEKGVLTANKEGTAMITVSSKEKEEIQDTITVTVIDVPVSLELNQTAHSMKATETFQLSAQLVYASGKKTAAETDKLTFESLNKQIVTVDEKGIVTGLVQSNYPLTADVKISYSVEYDMDGEKVVKNIAAQCQFTITKIPVEKIVIENKADNVTLKINDTYALKTSVVPANATDNTVSYKSSDKGVATVSSSGVITATGIGEATITAYTQENSSVKDTFVIKVYQTYFNVAELGVNGTDKSNDASKLNEILKYATLIDESITVYIPDGIYYISSTLKVYTETNIVLSDNAVIKRMESAGDKHMLISRTDPNGVQPGYTQCRDINISGGTWDGNATGAGSADCLYFGHAKNITVTNTTVKNNSGAHLIEFAGVQNVLVENVELYGYTMCKADGYTASQADKEAIQLDYCSEVSAPAMKPYDRTACDNVTIRNCNIYNYMAGIGTHTEGAIPSTNIRIENNNFENITNACINLRKFSNITISNNTAKNCTTFVYASGSQGIISNNTVTNGTSYTPATTSGLRAKNGITISNGSNFTVEGNTFEKAKSNGICVWNKSTAVIQNNKIKNNKLYGIRTQDSTITLKKNSFSKNTKGVYDTYKDAKVKSSDDIRAYYINIKKSYKYKGKSVKPKITIKGLSKKYYKVSYKNYKRPGTATVTIKGKGKVKQTLKIKYKITR